MLLISSVLLFILIIFRFRRFLWHGSPKFCLISSRDLKWCSEHAGLSLGWGIGTSDDQRCSDCSCWSPQANRNSSTRRLITVLCITWRSIGSSVQKAETQFHSRSLGIAKETDDHARCLSPSGDESYFEWRLVPWLVARSIDIGLVRRVALCWFRIRSPWDTIHQSGGWFPVFDGHLLHSPQTIQRMRINIFLSRNRECTHAGMRS